MMHSQTHRQRGTAHLLAIVLVVLVMGGIGAASYLVYLRQRDQRAAAPASQPSTTQQSTTLPATGVVMTMYSKVPSDLQTAILAETKSAAPGCVAGNRVVDYAKKPYDQPITYTASGYAFTVIGCDGRTQYLFVRQIGGWSAAEHTQAGFSCKTYQQYNVPTDIVAAADPTASNQATCLDASGNTVTYTTNP